MLATQERPKLWSMGTMHRVSIQSVLNHCFIEFHKFYLLDALPYFMELYYFKVAQFLQINCTRRRSFINKYTYYHAA